MFQSFFNEIERLKLSQTPLLKKFLIFYFGTPSPSHHSDWTEKSKKIQKFFELKSEILFEKMPGLLFWNEILKHSTMTKKEFDFASIHEGCFIADVPDDKNLRKEALMFIKNNPFVKKEILVNLRQNKEYLQKEIEFNQKLIELTNNLFDNLPIL